MKPVLNWEFPLLTALHGTGGYCVLGKRKGIVNFTQLQNLLLQQRPAYNRCLCNSGADVVEVTDGSLFVWI